MIDDYIEEISALVAAAKFVERRDVHFDKRGDEIVFMRGDLFFIDGSHLHFREFARQPQGATLERYSYAYHYQRADQTLIFRYDDAPHFPDLESFPHHKHLASETNVAAASAPDLATVLNEIEGLIEL